MGTLKHASMVQYLSERSSSLFRKTFTFVAMTARDFSHARGERARFRQRNQPPLDGLKTLPTKTARLYCARHIASNESG